MKYEYYVIPLSVLEEENTDWSFKYLNTVLLSENEALLKTLDGNIVLKVPEK